MKKVLALVLSMAMILALAACGSSSTTAATTATEAPAAAEATEAPAAAEATEAPAEEAVTYSIGICQLMQHDALDAATQGFMDAVTEALGDSVTFDLQNAQGDSTTCSTICTGFVANNVDLIMANATPALQAALAATTDIPVLGTSVTDYATALNDENLDDTVGTGINCSGTSDGVNAQIYADLVAELVPDAKNISAVYCSAEANSVVQVENFKACVEAMGMTCNVFTFSDSNDMQAVITSAIEDCDALYIPTDNTAASNMTIVSNVCEPAGIPVICGEENMCSLGGLATASISYYNIGYITGQMAVEILTEGADVSTMAIRYADDPVKEYNAEYAEAIGFAMPEGYTPIGG